MKLKRSERLIDMTQRLLDNPHTLISLTTFTALYQSAKSSISEDIAIIKKTFEKQGVGIIRTVPGAAGGVIFVPKIKREQALAAAEKLREQMNDASRLLPGGYIYLSDLLAKPDVLHDLGKMIASAYEDKKIDAVMTVATKGVPIAQTLASGSNVLIVDDFLKAGGTINGMRSLIQEFDSTTAGAVVFCESGVSNHNVTDYSSIIKITEIDTEAQTIKAELGNFFDKHEFL